MNLYEEAIKRDIHNSIKHLIGERVDSRIYAHLDELVKKGLILKYSIDKGDIIVVPNLPVKSINVNVTIDESL